MKAINNQLENKH